MRHLAVALLATALSAVAFTSARADFPGALVLGDGYGITTPTWSPWFGPLPDYGTALAVVGKVTGVAAPFDTHLPAGPYELTYTFTGLTCDGSGWGELQCNGDDFAYFGGGMLTVYLDDTPDADYANPGTFSDGQVVLRASFASLHGLDVYWYTYCSWLEGTDHTEQHGWLQFTGGAWFDLVHDNNDVGYSATDTGEFDGDVPDAIRQVGFTIRTTSSIDIQTPLATQTSTWGAVKALYRR